VQASAVIIIAVSNRFLFICFKDTKLQIQFGI